MLLFVQISYKIIVGQQSCRVAGHSARRTVLAFRILRRRGIRSTRHMPLIALGSMAPWPSPARCVWLTSYMLLGMALELRVVFRNNPKLHAFTGTAQQLRNGHNRAFSPLRQFYVQFSEFPDTRQWASVEVICFMLIGSGRFFRTWPMRLWNAAIHAFNISAVLSRPAECDSWAIPLKLFFFYKKLCDDRIVRRPKLRKCRIQCVKSTAELTWSWPHALVLIICSLYACQTANVRKSRKSSPNA